jgi:SepF-like predicted cell division protein (DUF552 family)
MSYIIIGGFEMKETFLNIKNKLSKAFTKDEGSSEKGEEYVSVDGQSAPADTGGKKVIVRPFVIQDFSDIKSILDVLREGQTIALINIRPLKDKDIIELKRAINKLKKTCDAIEGEIAGFGEDYIVVCPPFATVYKSKATKPVEAQEETNDEE